MKGKDKNRIVGVRIIPILAAVLLGLTGCGDDPAIGVSLSIKDLEEPLDKSTMPEESMDKSTMPEQISDELNETEAFEDSEESGTAEPVRITISAAGDVSLGNHQSQDYGLSFRQAFDQAESAAYFLENVYDIFSKDDMTIVNLEGALTVSQELREGQTYCIKGDPSYAEILTDGSVEAAAMGNNHRLDYMQQGSDDTVAALEAENIVWGYEENVGIFETKGIRIGFVAVNEVSQGAVVEKTLQEGIAELQKEGTDLILACCHWGIEGEYYPEDYQKSLGRKCIDWGADLVLGHHPHVLQGIEEYQGKYIVYSLGNFCFGANRNPADKDCMIFQQTFAFVNGEKQEEAPVRVIPCSVSSVSSRNDFKPTPAEGGEAERIMERINELSSQFGVAFDKEGNRKEKF